MMNVAIVSAVFVLAVVAGIAHRHPLAYARMAYVLIGTCSVSLMAISAYNLSVSHVFSTVILQKNEWVINDPCIDRGYLLVIMTLMAFFWFLCSLPRIGMTDDRDGGPSDN